MKTFVTSLYKNIQLYKNIARIAKAASHELPGMLSSNVRMSNRTDRTNRKKQDRQD